ncbi:MAG: DNA primase [Rubrivivax sp.]|jgi:DNA primase|nr:DNA primase [Rubrivivax sp.]
MIPAGFIQELLSRTDVVDVVSRHVDLKRGGSNWMGLCPFHAERSPSFSVSPSKQFFHCFGCGASGDAIRFLTEHLGLSFVEAVRDLAGRVGLQVPEEQVSPDERQRRDTLRERRRSLSEVLDKAASFYRGELKSASRAIDYLKGRGLSGAVAARFGIGYAPPGWKTLAGVFPNYDDPVLEDAGLVRQREAQEAHEGSEPARGMASGRYDWFRDRVMFPIRAVGGEVIGFGGRVLDDSKPKYINSPETPVFSKGRELYGLFEARQAIRERGFVLVVEGYMDVVALAQSGHANAVATLGTACTADHVQKLFRFTDTVVFSFDGDGAGRRAASRALEAALPHASDLRSVRFLFLPSEHDPDSYVRELGSEAFAQAVKQAVPLSRQLLEDAAADADLDQAEGRARFLAQAQVLWQALPEGRLRDQILSDIAERGRAERAELALRWRPAVGRSGNPEASDGRPNEPTRRDGPEATVAPTFRPRRPASPLQRPRPQVRQPQDQVARILLQRLEWWHELGHEDHAGLVASQGWQGPLFAWIDRWLVEHEAVEWPRLREALRDERARLLDDLGPDADDTSVADWPLRAIALIDEAEVLDEPALDQLQAAMSQARRAGSLADAQQVLAALRRH